jgi:hypothetical protein
VKFYPLVFSFRDAIMGNGFVANVSMNGRALLSTDDEETWLFGVQPGAISGGDPRRDVAFTAFKKSYLSVLLDIAAEATSFDEFTAEVTSLFSQANEPFAADWETALGEVRSQNTSLADLKRVSADSRPPSLEVELVITEKAVIATPPSLLALPSRRPPRGPGTPPATRAAR